MRSKIHIYPLWNNSLLLILCREYSIHSINTQQPATIQSIQTQLYFLAWTLLNLIAHKANCNIVLFFPLPLSWSIAPLNISSSVINVIGSRTNLSTYTMGSHLVHRVSFRTSPFSVHLGRVSITTAIHHIIRLVAASCRRRRVAFLTSFSPSNFLTRFFPSTFFKRFSRSLCFIC